MAKVIRGFWDCKSCGRKGIDGLLDSCPGCGAGTDKNVRYYMKSAEDTVTEQELTQAGIGLDELDGRHREWICAYCGYLNNYKDLNCVKCGGPKEEKTQDYGENPLPDTTDSTQTAEEPADPEAASLRAGGKKRILLPFLLLIPVILIILFFIPFKKSRTVTGFEWTRSISIEALETVEKSDWELPENATLVESKEEYYKTNQVLDHYETDTVTRSREVVDHYEDETEYVDNGNGTFSEETHSVPVYTTEYYEEEIEVPVYVSVPEYRTKYYYEVDEWIFKEELETSGMDQDPYWYEGYTLMDNERDTTRSEHYYVQLSDDTRQEMTYDEWKGLSLSDKITVKRSLVGR